MIQQIIILAAGHIVKEHQMLIKRNTINILFLKDSRFNSW
jgi:hypothetical protein